MLGFQTNWKIHSTLDKLSGNLLFSYGNHPQIYILYNICICIWIYIYIYVDVYKYICVCVWICNTNSEALLNRIWALGGWSDCEKQGWPCILIGPYIFYFGGFVVKTSYITFPPTICGCTRFHFQSQRVASWWIGHVEMRSYLETFLCWKVPINWPLEICGKT